MNYLTYFRKLKSFFRKLYSTLMRFLKRKQPKISLLIPFSSTDTYRQKNLNWLLEYWKHELPDAEVIIGKSHSRIFSKAEALNDAVSRSKGKILAIVDADAYIPGAVLDEAADMMLANLDNNLWYVPYRRLYRLTYEAAKLVIDSDPSNPYRFPSPIPESMIHNAGHSTKYGHRHGAMLMMFPRQAYDTIGGFDERFKGWGGEDVCLLHTLDTLYGKHKTTNNEIYHLWHPFYGDTYQQRHWAGQTGGGSNKNLSSEYNRATGKPKEMRKIMDDAAAYRKKMLLEKE